ncbi:MAG: transcriptional regulator [Spirochaetota bacterium]
MNNYIDATAREDFNRARFREMFSRITNALTPENQELLSLREVRDVIRPRSEVYRGMQTVPIDRIAGSEGRYRDFNKGFLPKREASRGRWTSIDRAHLQFVTLPPIRLYEIGGIYFVRDGNHRVSVARSQGVMAIDAEVTSLGTEIQLDPRMSRADLKRAVIAYEKQRFYDRTRFDRLFPEYDLVFTEPGRYDEVIHHIEVHKYYLNQSFLGELSFEDAMVSWYNNVFRPITDLIEAENILSRFPGRTAADLYIWIVKHWDELKQKYGPDFPVQEAARDYASRYGKDFKTRLKEGLGHAMRRLRRRG